MALSVLICLMLRCSLHGADRTEQQSNPTSRSTGIVQTKEGARHQHEESATKSQANRLIAPDGAEMVLVPAGPFIMGSLEGKDDEKPPHLVSLPAFYMDKHEVTCQQYQAFLKATGRKAPVDWPEGKMPQKLARHPVVNVTFDDAEAYARWAGKRLPTEAEWEKACRGSQGRVYPWGNSPTGKNSATPIGDNSKDHTWPVGSFPDDVSPYGAMDMAGNAWEWTASWYEAYPGNDQLEIEYGKKYRVIRGSGAIDYYGATGTRRGAERARSLPYGTYDALGFRCVEDAKTP
ncbi:MAG TPA: formylglycine-generating enzyme family protein [Clostridia bacterium]|nr:formylglycine-generating enzyme family protein [Clostridia bacterium]